MPNINTARNLDYSDEFKTMAFTVWYENGKPSYHTLYSLMNVKVDPLTGLTLQEETLGGWIKGGFTQKAIQLDQQVIQKLDDALVSDKLAMLERHAGLGQEMQKIGIDFLRDKGVDRPRDAIMLLVHGVEIEREAKSVPRFLSEITQKTDEELIEELKKLASGQETPLLDLPTRDVDIE